MGGKDHPSFQVRASEPSKLFHPCRLVTRKINGASWTFVFAVQPPSIVHAETQHPRSECASGTCTPVKEGSIRAYNPTLLCSGALRGECTMFRFSPSFLHQVWSHIYITVVFFFFFLTRRDQELLIYIYIAPHQNKQTKLHVSFGKKYPGSSRFTKSLSYVPRPHLMRKGAQGCMLQPHLHRRGW